MDFVTDRTQTDVDIGSEKAYMKHTDLERVELSISYMLSFFNIPYSFVTYANRRVPNTTDYERIYNGLVSINDNLPITTLTFPIRPFNTFSKWNELEKYLYITYNNVYAMFNNYFYLGEGYLGEET